MKQKIRVTFNGKTIEGEKTIRNLDHFEIQLKTRAHTFKTKKGKGSYTRKSKHKNLDFWFFFNFL